MADFSEFSKLDEDQNQENNKKDQSNEAYEADDEEQNDEENTSVLSNKVLKNEPEKKQSVETDIRKNYIDTLIPIKVIRQRFKMVRREGDLEHFMNYV